MSKEVQPPMTSITNSQSIKSTFLSAWAVEDGNRIGFLEFWFGGHTTLKQRHMTPQDPFTGSHIYGGISLDFQITRTYRPIYIRMLDEGSRYQAQNVFSLERLLDTTANSQSIQI